MPIFRARELSFMLELAEIRILVAPRERESSRICLRSDDAPPPDRAGRGPITAIAIETFAPPMGVFKRGRDFAGWLGLAPRQHSTGGKQVLGRISKMGQRDIRQLLIMGAMTVVRWACRKGAEGTWQLRMLARKPRMLVAIALANKMPVQYGPC